MGFPGSLVPQRESEMVAFMMALSGGGAMGSSCRRRLLEVVTGDFSGGFFLRDGDSREVH